MGNRTDFRILGSLEVTHDGQHVALQSPKQRQLLALLVIRAGEVVGTESLLDSLWGADPPSAPLKTLRFHVSKLRAALRETSEDIASLLVTHAPGYRLEAEPAQVDAARFEAGVRSARRLMDLAPAEAASLLLDALGEWRGPALADFTSDEFAQPEIRRLEELRLAAIADRIDAQLASGGGAGLVAELESLVAQHPTHEKLWALLMVALYRDGRTGDSLQAYQRARFALAEAGVMPSEELSAVEAKVLADDLEVRPSLLYSSPGLPAPITDLIGRSHDVENVQLAVIERRLVTIVGVGGVGKTSVALQSAHDLAKSGRHVVWTELAAISDPGQVPARLAAAMNVRDQPGWTTVEAVSEHLRHHPTVLAIDNCEHLLSDVAPLVLDLLSACPDLRILATSREPLRLPGERVMLLKPLPVPEGLTAEEISDSAIVLFETRAQDLEPSQSSSELDRETIGRICRMLDGVPLAIELAAARIGVMTPRELEIQLQDRFRLLTSQDRGRPERHTSLEATVRWSYERLSAHEKILLERLSIFAGNFSLRAIEHVCSFDPIDRDRIVDLTSDLVAKSLVARQASSATAAFRLLETVREWAALALGRRGDSRQLADRHADYCRAAASAPPNSGDGLETLNNIAADVDKAIDHLVETNDLESAVELIGLCFTSWAHIGRSHAYQRSEAFLPLIGDLSPVSRGSIFLGAGTMAQSEDLDRAQELLQAAVREFRAATACACHALNNLGAIDIGCGRYEQAVDVLQQSIDEKLARSCVQNGRFPWPARGNLALALIGLDRLEEARVQLDLCASEAAACGWQEAGLADIGLAEIMRREGDLVGARDLLSARADSVETSSLRLGYGAGFVNCDLARIEMSLGQVDDARTHIVKSLSIYSRIVSIDDVYDALVVASTVAEAINEWRAAAFILGGTSTWVARQRLVLRPDSMELLDRASAKERSALGAVAFDGSWTAGGEASLAQLSEHFLELVR